MRRLRWASAWRRELGLMLVWPAAVACSASEPADRDVALGQSTATLIGAPACPPELDLVALGCPPGTNPICGSEDDDHLVGTPGDDCILGFGGNDVIRGGNGNDVLIGGEGDDVLHGENGNDILIGGPGNDTLDGGNGDDVLDGGEGDDVIGGGNGGDVISGGAGDDTISGGNGGDVISGGDGNDTIESGGGEDSVDAGDGNDTVDGAPDPCTDGLTDCAGICVDTAADPAHCGACRTACASGELCDGGRCVPAGPPPCTGPVFFSPSQALGPNDDVREVVTADLNSDGAPDLVLVGNHPNRVYLGDGTGGFELLQSLEWSSDISGTLGDLNGDGVPDLVAAGDGARVYLNDGTGWFTLVATLGPQQQRKPGIFDLNGDGLNDLVLLNGYPGGYQIWLNDPAAPGRFTLHQERPLGITVDADYGWLGAQFGVVLRGYRTGTCMLLADGLGGLVESWCVAGTASYDYGAALGDIDGDGLADLVLGSEAGSVNSVWLGDGTGGFQPGGWFGKPSYVASLALGDLDNDGNRDVAIATWGHDSSESCADPWLGCFEPDEIWLNDGAGGFRLAQELGDAASYTVAIVDVDGDQDQDLVLGEIYASYPNERATRVWLNHCR